MKIVKMVFKSVVLCIFAVLGQSTAGSYYRNSIPSSYADSNRVSTSATEDSSQHSSEGIAIPQVQSSYKPISAPLISENGRTFTVTSVGRIAPAGIAVAADLGLSGQLEVAGGVPYLSAVAFEGQFNSKGSTAVSYGCGDGCIAITEEFGKESPSYGIPSLGDSGNKF